MVIYLRNKTSLEVENNSTAKSVLTNYLETTYKNVVACTINGKLNSLGVTLQENDELDFVLLKDKLGLVVYRHTIAHILAQAIKNIYPTCFLAQGGELNNGFYYDVDFKTPIKQEDFSKIEQEMKAIIKSDMPIEKFLLAKKEARKLMKNFDEPYKVQLIEDMQDVEYVSLYKQGAFVDLCDFPHMYSTGKIKNFKLISISGAYFKGNRKNKMLTRIFGVAFEKKSLIEEYIKNLQELKKKSFNCLGKKLSYFENENIDGKIVPKYLEKANQTILTLKNLVEKVANLNGYDKDLSNFKLNLDFYRSLKIINKTKKSYNLQDLKSSVISKINENDNFPIKLYSSKNIIGNFNNVSCRSLVKTNSFNFCDSYVACLENQIEKELNNALTLSINLFKVLGLKEIIFFKVYNANSNNILKNSLKNILESLGINFVYAESSSSLGTLKIDILTKTITLKEEILSTILVDSDNFNKYYFIYSSIIGCYEKLLAIMVEKHQGELPLIVAPYMATINSTNDKCKEYIDFVKEKLINSGIRVNENLKDLTVSKKVRNSYLDKTPYIIVIGDKEKNSNTISVKKRKDENFASVSVEDFISIINKEIEKI